MDTLSKGAGYFLFKIEKELKLLKREKVPETYNTSQKLVMLYLDHNKIKYLITYFDSKQ